MNYLIKNLFKLIYIKYFINNKIKVKNIHLSFIKCWKKYAVNIS